MNTTALLTGAVGFLAGVGATIMGIRWALLSRPVYRK